MKMLIIEDDRHNRTFAINPNHICSIKEGEEVFVGNTSDNKKEVFNLITFSGNAGNAGFAHQSILTKKDFKELVQEIEALTLKFD